jgi:BirA family biotin operon repressor/biotin-[acetyl-CoA-carboxylase] ligase
VNLAASEFSPELRKVATSLKIEAGRHIQRAELAASILRELDCDYEHIREQRFARLAAEWEEHCATLGRRVSVDIGERVLQGQAEALDEDGALLLRTQHGRLERIIGGDVTLQK